MVLGQWQGHQSRKGSPFGPAQGVYIPWGWRSQPSHLILGLGAPLGGWGRVRGLAPSWGVGGVGGRAAAWPDQERRPLETLTD